VCGALSLVLDERETMVSGGKMGAVVPWRLRSTRIVALARLSSPTISVLRRSRVLSTRRRAARRSFCSRQLDRARAGQRARLQRWLARGRGSLCGGEEQ